MSSLIAGIALAAFAALSLLGKRWAFWAFLVIAVGRIPARTGFDFVTPACQLEITAAGAAAAMAKVPHIVLFAVFFLIVHAQLSGRTRSRFGWAALATLAFGAVIELEQGLTRTGNCRARDLIQDAKGALLGAAVVLLLRSTRALFTRGRQSHGR